jgi:hypothetical protein
MRLYSDKLTEADIYDAARKTGVIVWECARFQRPRVRANGWNLYLMGTSPYTSQATGERAATWDEHGLWMAELYKRDPNLRVSWYRDLAHFVQVTRDERDCGYNRDQPESKRKRAPWLHDLDLLALVR